MAELTIYFFELQEEKIWELDLGKVGCYTKIMRYSKYPFKTKKTIGRDLQSKNARLLIQAGFIHQEMAGVYTFLPLGLRVLTKIEQIVREEMDKIGIEISMTALSLTKNWEQTARLDTVDVLMKTAPANELARAKNDTEYILNSTHEELVTPLVQSFNKSYKDLPVAVYQIQTKFRNEPRAKSGLLRCREFRMKDLYSFHSSEEDLKKYYEKVKEAYWKVFERLGIENDTLLTLASGGDFTSDYSHEFQTICDTGEDTIFHAKKANITFNREIAPSMAPPMDDSKEEMKQRQDVKGAGIIGVEELAKYLKIPVQKTTKTILFETEKNETVAVAVRGGYDINEEKVKKIVGCKVLKLASRDKVKRVTGAEVGYAGILNLPKSIKVYFDESMKGRRNFETGANKTNYHSINVNFGRDLPEPKEYYDLKLAREGDRYPETGEVYKVYRAAEVGNIFPLGTKFSKAFGYTFTDQQGKQKPVYMGCYGLGSSRVMGVLVEKFSDEKGIVWPENVAPFAVHLIHLGGVPSTPLRTTSEVRRVAEEVYEKLQKAGIEVLWDDREDVSAGVKFADADLIGIPVRLVISQKTKDTIEWKKRTDQKTEFLSLSEVLEKLS